MANLKYTVVWLVLLLVHFNPQLVGSTPIPLTTTKSAQTNPPPTAPNLVLCPHFPPAECPPEDVWDNECMTDRNCTEMHPGHQFKCCDVGCQYRCIPPAKVKLPTFLPQASLQVKGTCPVFPAIAECPEHIYDECIDDQQCDEFYPGIGFKCCQDGCGMICLPPEQEMTPTTQPPTYPFTLTCPYLPPAKCPADEVWDNKCMTDMNCTEMHPGKELKCCDIGCQFKCIPPVKVMVPFTQPVTMPVHGACPVLPTPDQCPRELQIEPECVNDQECAKWYPGRGMKCCRDGCDMRCVAPVARTTPTPPPLTSQVNFTCPFFTPGRNCPPEEDLDHECTDDAKCIQLYPGKGLKCCKDGCYNICVAPVDANAPTTPPLPFPYTLKCPVLPPAGCPQDEDLDHECRTDLKCAELYPGHEFKCCMEGCEYRCIKPIREKVTTHQPIMPAIGTCPPFFQLPECPEDLDHECKNDQECAELHPGLGMKCCRDEFCEMICVAPVPLPTSPVKRYLSSVHSTS